MTQASNIRPLTARSVIASLLLGTQPPQLPGAALVKAAGLLGCAEGAVRVALSRMAASGELVADAGVYRLGERLLERQRRQDEGRRAATRRWDGTWVLAVVGGGAPRPAADRAALRRSLAAACRMAEWREGVWGRPDNLVADRPVLDGCSWVTGARIEVAPMLWDVAAWAATAEALLDGMARDRTLGDRFALAAAVVRHLRDDPQLPPSMLPDGWPGERLRTRYDSYERAIRVELRPIMQGAV